MSNKATKIALLVVCVLLALEYAFAGIPKLMGQDEAVQGFRHAGFSDGFRLFIGAAEVSGALGLLVPRLRFWAATGLSIIMIGRAGHARTRPRYVCEDGAGGDLAGTAGPDSVDHPAPTDPLSTLRSEI